MSRDKIYVALDEMLSLYSFPEHPFNAQRFFAFREGLKKKGLISLLGEVKSKEATLQELLLFHDKDYIEFVREKEKVGGYLDLADTPAFDGIFRAAKIVVGTTLNCIDIAVAENTKVFNPVGGLHHAFKDRAGGFCVFNDVCVGINYLRKKYNIKSILYFDIDAHHGDGVYYSFADDPEIFIVDTHQKGIFPGTGKDTEIGIGKAALTKLNIELEAYTEDKAYFKVLEKVRDFLKKIKIDFIIFQAGADCLSQDPLTNLGLSEGVHREVTKILSSMADEQTQRRMLILGGGGYLLSNVQRGWISVIDELLK